MEFARVKLPAWPRVLGQSKRHRDVQLSSFIPARAQKYSRRLRGSLRAEIRATRPLVSVQNCSSATTTTFTAFSRRPLHQICARLHARNALTLCGAQPRSISRSCNKTRAPTRTARRSCTTRVYAGPSSCPSPLLLSRSSPLRRRRFSTSTSRAICAAASAKESTAAASRAPGPGEGRSDDRDARSGC